MNNNINNHINNPMNNNIKKPMSNHINKRLNNNINNPMNNNSFNINILSFKLIKMLIFLEKENFSTTHKNIKF